MGVPGANEEYRRKQESVCLLGLAAGQLTQLTMILSALPWIGQCWRSTETLQQTAKSAKFTLNSLPSSYQNGIILTSCQKEFFLNQRAHFPRYLQSFKTLILACEKRVYWRCIRYLVISWGNNPCSWEVSERKFWKLLDLERRLPSCFLSILEC